MTAEAAGSIKGWHEQQKRRASILYWVIRLCNSRMCRKNPTFEGTKEELSNNTGSKVGEKTADKLKVGSASG